jgi:hypothetical protein
MAAEPMIGNIDQMNCARTYWRAAIRLGRILGLGGAIAACGAPPAGGASPGSPAARPAAAAVQERSAARPRALSYLQDDYERLFPERVRLARYGEARYAAGDPRDAGGDGDRSDPIEMGAAPALVVVDQVLDRVRVIAPQDHLRMLLWIDDNDLYTVMTRSVVVVGAAADPGAALRVRPGLPVEIDGERRGMAHVKHRDGCVSFSGWVPRSAVGKQFIPVVAAVGQASSMVTAGSVVVERPGGREVARFLADCEAIETGPESDGFRPIRYATEWFDVRGWVATGTGKATGVASGGSSWGYGLGHLGMWGSRTRFRLDEGTCLYARRGGPAIGLVTEDTDAPLSPATNGWRQVPIESGWGDLTVWVAEDHPGKPKPAMRERRPGRGHDRAHAPGAEIVPDEDDASGGGGDSGASGEPERPTLRRCS